MNSISKKDEKILEAIVKKLGKEGVEYIKKNKELPPIKLTSEEMKVLNGGYGTLDAMIRIAQNIVKTGNAQGTGKGNER